MANGGLGHTGKRLMTEELPRSSGVIAAWSRPCLVLLIGALLGAGAALALRADATPSRWDGVVTAGGCVADVSLSRNGAEVLPRSPACRVTVLTSEGPQTEPNGGRVQAVGEGPGVEVWLEDGENCDAVVWDEGWSLPAAVPGCRRS